MSLAPKIVVTRGVSITDDGLSRRVTYYCPLGIKQVAVFDIIAQSVEDVVSADGSDASEDSDLPSYESAKLMNGFPNLGNSCYLAAGELSRNYKSFQKTINLFSNNLPDGNGC